MSVEHVRAWDDNRKSWRPITIDEAVTKYSHKVASGTGIFVCSICCQAVTLAAVTSSKQKAHFRHSRTTKEEEKWCEDRTKQYSSDELKNNLQFRKLPIRIIHRPEDKYYSFELGLFKKDRQYCERILITNSLGEVKNYNFERILNNDSGFEYLNVGTTPSEEYTIRYEGASSEFNKYYPNTVAGLDSEGTLFSKNTGKILRHNSKARLNENYLLLIRKDRIKFISSLFGKINLLSIDQITKQGLHVKYLSELREGFEPWIVYQVKAYDLTQTSTLFFLRMGVELLDFKQQIILLGPRLIANECVVRVFSSYFYIFSNSRNPEIVGFAEHEKRKVKSVDAGSIWKLKIKDVDRWVSFSRSGEYQQFYLEKQQDAPLLKILTERKVIVKDIKDVEVAENLYTKLPLNNSLIVLSPWDGCIEILFNGNLITKEKLFANSGFEIRNLRFNSVVKIYVGCDLYRSIEFKKSLSNAKKDLNLETLLKDRTMSRQQIPLSLITASSMKILGETELDRLRALALSGQLPKRVLNYLESKRGL